MRIALLLVFCLLSASVTFGQNNLGNGDIPDSPKCQVGDAGALVFADKNIFEDWSFNTPKHQQNKKLEKIMSMGQAGTLNPGIKVTIVSTAGEGVEIRVLGQTTSFWTMKHSLSCP
jgi:hypothetical protein